MKIIGITYLEDTCYITLKTDSSLLINQRPFFIPTWDEEFVVQPCIVIRICRLGKNIEEKYVDRYYDMIAYGLDFRANGLLRKIRNEGGDWSKAVSFDNSLCVGNFISPTTTNTTDNYAMTIQQTVASISQFYTIRQGDFLYIDKREGTQKIYKDQLFKIEENKKILLYCKIK